MTAALFLEAARRLHDRFRRRTGGPHAVVQVRGHAELKTKNFRETLHAA